MLAKFNIIILMISVAAGSNLHLPILQMTAWAGMVVAYSQESDLSTAVEQTFSGERPCSLCTAIKDQQMETASKEWQPVTPPPFIWFNDCLLPWRPTMVACGSSHFESPVCEDQTLTPDTPPPRFVAA